MINVVRKWPGTDAPGSEKQEMLKSCANPECAKPLHYLRDGRVFVFDAMKSDDGNGIKAHRMEHFWLCGDCSETMMLERTRTGVRVVARTGVRSRRVAAELATLAS